MVPGRGLGQGGVEGGSVSRRDDAGLVVRRTCGGATVLSEGMLVELSTMRLSDVLRRGGCAGTGGENESLLLKGFEKAWVGVVDSLGAGCSFTRCMFRIA